MPCTDGGGSLLTILLEDGRLVNAQVSRQVEWNRFAIKVDGQGGWARDSHTGRFRG